MNKTGPPLAGALALIFQEVILPELLNRDGMYTQESYAELDHADSTSPAVKMGLLVNPQLTTQSHYLTHSAAVVLQSPVPGHPQLMTRHSTLWDLGSSGTPCASVTRAIRGCITTNLLRSSM